MEIINLFFWIPHPRPRRASSAGRHEEMDVAFLHRMLSLKNKKQNRVVFALTLFLFSAGVFFLTSQGVNAEESFVSQVGSAVGGAVGGAFTAALNWMLYGVFVLLGWITSMAVTLFEWAINPDYISGRGGLLNKESIYENWKFIRDFFNLFFILTLLYTAFTIVFQVAKDYKQTLLSLVLAAMFINFSFPITRVIIDVSNVPMYYFVNQMMAKEEGKNIFGNFLGASKIQDALIPKNFNPTTGDTTQLLVAIVMLFLFTISILVLSVMMVIRLVALVILLIFSSVGFAAAIIPGLQKYSSMWWENLFKYALFGPASMLMLLIATRFFAEIGDEATRAGFTQAGMRNTIPETTKLISSMAQFSIPIIMMWFAIGLSSSMALFGGTAVAGQGQKFAKWAGRKTYNNPVGRGFYSGAKARVEDTKVGRWFKSPSGIEARMKGWTKKTSLNPVPFWRESGKGRAGARTELEKLHVKQVNEMVKKNKENQVTDSAHIGNLGSNDRIEREAAALSLAESKGIRSAETLAMAITAVGDNNDAVAKILDSARPEAIGSINSAEDSRIRSAFYEYERDPKTNQFVLNDDGITRKVKRDANGNEVIREGMRDAHDAYNSKLKKEGNLKIRIDYEINRKINETLVQAKAAGPVDPAREGEIRKEARTEVYDNLLSKLGADDLAKQGSIHSAIATDTDLKEFLKKKVEDDPQFYTEAMKKMSVNDRNKWMEISPKEAKKTNEGEQARPRLAAIKQEHGK